MDVRRWTFDEPPLLRRLQGGYDRLLRRLDRELPLLLAATAALLVAAGWAVAHFGSDSINPNIAGVSADPDHDGIVNLLEYAHATDPHAPYRPPAGFEEKFANPADTPEFNRNYVKLRDKAQYGGGTVISRALCAKSGVNPDRFIHRAIDRYDGEVLHNDWSLQQLVDKLKQIGVLDNTLIVVVSDHGECKFVKLVGRYAWDT